MAPILRKTMKIIARTLGAVLAFLLLALVILQIALTVGINMLSTGRGTDFISGKINQSLESSGYSVDFDALHYDPVRGITVKNLAVADREGIFLTLDHLSLAASLALAPLRELDLALNGGTLSLARLPATAEKNKQQEEPDSLQPFETPDIYFRTITLSAFKFDQVILSETVAGKEYVFSPSLQARAGLAENITLNLNIKPGMLDIAPGLPAPENLNFAGALTPSTLDAIIEKFDINADSYGFSMKGTASLKEDGVLHLSAESFHDDLAGLTQNAFGGARASAKIDGPLSGPAIDLTALLSTKDLKERGLSDIAVTVKTDNITQGMQGTALVETSYREKPVRLESLLSYEAPNMTLTDLKGTAPALSLIGGGVLSTETMLFNGDLQLLADDLAHYKDLAGIALAGKAEVKAKLASTANSEQSADISLHISDGVVDAHKIGKLSAQAFFASLATPWPQSGKIDASSISISDGAAILDSLNGKITATENEAYKLTIKGQGKDPVAMSFDGSAQLKNLAQKIPDIQDIALMLRHGGSAVKLAGNFNADKVDLSLTGNNVCGRDVPAALPAQLEDMLIDLDAAMTGTPAKPMTDLTAKLSGIGEGAYRNASLDIKAQHNGQNIHATITGNGTGIRKLSADADFPMALALMPFDFSFDQNAPLKGSLVADLDLAALSPLFLPPTQSLSGDIAANGIIAGTLSLPQPTATIALRNASFIDDQNGIEIDDLAAKADVSREKIILTSLTATDGKQGKISGSGSVYFGQGATDLSLQIRDFNAPRGNMADGVFSADLAMKGSADALRLTGKADITEMNVLIPETFASRIPQLNIVEDEKKEGPDLLSKLALDMTIDAHNRVFVRGRGLDAEFGGNVAITGTAAAPQFNGTLESRRGRFEEFGKRFTLERANLRFQGQIPPSPYLDIEATTQAEDVTGAILFTGPVQSPTIKFSSTPALPEDEVLSRILFGKEATKISPFQAVQLAQTIQRFSGKGGGASFDPLGMIRSATGLDDISVETDESGEANVEAGKYLTDNVYLELSKGKAENSGAATIQIEVTPSVNIESEIGQDAQGGGGVFWKHDY